MWIIWKLRWDMFITRLCFESSIASVEATISSSSSSSSTTNSKSSSSSSSSSKRPSTTTTSSTAAAPGSRPHCCTGALLCPRENSSEIKAVNDLLLQVDTISYTIIYYTIH